MDENDTALCAASASLLRATRVLAHWGLALSGVAALVLGLALPSLSTPSAMGFGAVALLGVLERYFAFRLAFDQRLFDALAQGRIASLPALDAALERLGLRRAPATPRTLAERVDGIRLLLRRHRLVLLWQSGMFLLALLTQDLP